MLLTAIPAQVQAQDEDDAIEEVVVTGSYIRRTSQFDSPSPIQNVDATQLESIGAKNIADVVQTLTINTGSQNNPDAFTQNSTTGTSNFNLRGLGVASTLVLLNGKRQVLTGLPTNDGLNFVDTSSLVPLIAVDNIEILKD
ncbi:MAG: TonB-dependent receptor plug domain-containing protein, partial [Pseudomonadota bacterium]